MKRIYSFSDYVRYFIIFISVFVITFTNTSPTVLAAVDTVTPPTDQPFKDGNIQMNYKECEKKAKAAATTPASTTTPGTSSGSGGGGGCGNDADGDPANKKQVKDFLMTNFMSEGFTQEEAENATSGVMGNWRQESNFDSYKIDEGEGCDTDGTSNTHEPAFGIAQWCFGRIDQLKNFASQQPGNRPATCLGVQLEYMWHEMTNSYSHLFDAMKGKSASEAASIFNLGGNGGGGFEVGADNDKRMSFATEIHKEITGQSVDPVATSGSGSGANTSPTATSDCDTTTAAAAATAGGSIPSSAECKAMQDKVNQLKASNKITFDKEGAIQRDIDACNKGSILRCGAAGGSHPNTLRGIAAAAEAPGINSIQLWNINSEHPCDKFDHPVGLATDIKQCNGKEAASDEAECIKVFDHLVENSDELDISYIIWSGKHCEAKKSSNSKIRCDSVDHDDHIHVSFNGEPQGSL